VKLRNVPVYAPVRMGFVIALVKPQSANAKLDVSALVANANANVRML
jgi:hypothetical protein